MINAFKPYVPVLTFLSDVNPYTVESLTRDIDIKPLHSHNDYWRQVPFYDALSHGFQSIESDIWKFETDYTVQTTTGTTRFDKHQIYVGHNQVFLKTNETLDSLYLDPIFELLESVNPKISNLDAGIKHGVYYNSPETSLYLWMDIKLDGDHTYEYIEKRLEKFRQKDYLTYYDLETEKMVERPLVVVLTGNLPTVDKIKTSGKVYTFLDAPLHKLVEMGHRSEDELKEYSKISRVASGSMEQVLGHKGFTNAEFTEEDKRKLGDCIGIAHKYGLKTRIWGGIDWPTGLVFSQNMDLLRLGCDLINTNDLNFGTVLTESGLIGGLI